MAVTVVKPGAVAVYSGTPSIVGSPPQWGDDSDATYAEMTTTTGGVRQDDAEAPFDPVGVLSATEATLCMRYAATNTGATVYTAGIVFEAFYGIDLPLTTDGATHDTRVLLTDANFYSPNGITLADFLMLFASGTVVRARANTAFSGATETRTLTVFELWMEFTMPGSQPLYAAPLRLTQRGDGLTGGAPRLTGSRSRQASNRLLGGYL